MRPQDIWQLLKASAREWDSHNAPRLGAALAYYTLLSLAPVAVLLVLICGLLFARQNAEQHLLDQIREMAGDEWVSILKSVIENTRPTKGGIVGSIFALAILFFGASGVFLELRDSLNIIWDAPPASGGVGAMIRRRISGFVMVFGFGLLMLISILADISFRVISTHFAGVLPVQSHFLAQTVSAIVSFVALTAFFALIFKFVPDVPIAWRDVFVGAAATALLFNAGRFFLTLYLTKAAVGSAFGAAGSLVALVVWIYYCSQIFFFGATFTRVYAERFNSPPAVPSFDRTASGKSA